MTGFVHINNAYLNTKKIPTKDDALVHDCYTPENPPGAAAPAHNKPTDLGTTGMYETVIGLDIGHSAVKITYDGRDGIARALIPSVACTAFPLNNEAEAAQAATETVEVAGRSYFVGNTALRQGRGKINTGLSADWIETPEHAALIKQSRNIISQKTNPGPHIYVVGLPIKQYIKTSKDRLREVCKEMLEIDSDDSLLIMPQPMGGYYTHMFDRHGMPQKGRSLTDQSYAVIDVGYYSTDFVLLHEGHWIEQACDGCEGVSRAATELMRLVSDELGMDITLQAAEKALATGTLKRRGLAVDVDALLRRAAHEIAAQVEDKATRLLAEYIDDINGILVIGGGASLVLPTLSKKWDHAVNVEDKHREPEHKGSRYLVSEGYYRFGRHKLFLDSAG